LSGRSCQQQSRDRQRQAGRDLHRAHCTGRRVTILPEMRDFGCVWETIVAECDEGLFARKGLGRGLRLVPSELGRCRWRTDGGRYSAWHRASLTPYYGARGVVQRVAGGGFGCKGLVLGWMGKFLGAVTGGWGGSRWQLGWLQASAANTSGSSARWQYTGVELNQVGWLTSTGGQHDKDL
jgi:hypothetical protein